jgi:hypothetical protein
MLSASFETSILPLFESKRVFRWGKGHTTDKKMELEPLIPPTLALLRGQLPADTSLSVYEALTHLLSVDTPADFLKH